MKTIALLCTLLVSFAFSVDLANAQSKSFSYYSQETLHAIGASAEQQVKIKQIHHQTNSLVRAIQKDTNLSEDEKKAKIKETYAAGAKLYNESLTQEQLNKVKELQRAFREKQKNN